jgi:hypothetical protein
MNGRRRIVAYIDSDGFRKINQEHADRDITLTRIIEESLAQRYSGKAADSAPSKQFERSVR